MVSQRIVIEKDVQHSTIFILFEKKYMFCYAENLKWDIYFKNLSEPAWSDTDIKGYRKSYDHILLANNFLNIKWSQRTLALNFCGKTANSFVGRTFPVLSRSSVLPVQRPMSLAILLWGNLMGGQYNPLWRDKQFCNPWLIRNSNPASHAWKKITLQTTVLEKFNGISFCLFSYRKKEMPMFYAPINFWEKLVHAQNKAM